MKNGFISDNLASEMVLYTEDAKVLITKDAQHLDDQQNLVLRSSSFYINLDDLDTELRMHEPKQETIQNESINLYDLEVDLAKHEPRMKTIHNDLEK